MQVRLRIQFKPPTDEDRRGMRSLANSLTEQPDSVRVSADADPEWLVAEFTMPTEAQYKAVPKIDRAIRFYADNRLDSTIAFPHTQAERERADRRAARRKARRRGERWPG
jgi:hypothetical protein